MNTYFGVTFQDGKKEIFIPCKIYSYQNKHDAKTSSMDFSFTRCESDDGTEWCTFYRGKEIKITIIKSEFKL